MTKSVILVLLSVIGYALSIKDQPVSYKNYRIYDVADYGNNGSLHETLEDEESFEVLREYRNFKERGDSFTVRSYLVPPYKEDAFLRTLEDAGNLNYSLTVKDLGKSIEQEKKVENTRRFQKQGSFEEFYHSYDEIGEFLQRLRSADNAYRSEPLAIIEKTEKTYEGRDLFLVKISSDHSLKKPIIFFEAGIHAREWTAPATAIYMIHQLVENYTAHADILRNIDFYVIPVSNPDGYEYSRTRDRMWRKTRSLYHRHYGTDGNRNFDYHWGERGTSDNPKSEIFRGPRPFSEPETRNIRDIGKKYSDRIKAFVSIHAFGPCIVYPWSYAKTDPAPNRDIMDKVAKEAAASIRKLRGTEYDVGVSSELMYEAAGGADDYFKGVLDVDLAYTVEVSSAGENSFVVPSSKILGIASEVFEGFKVIAKYASEMEK